MATENILMHAVTLGGDRQELHEAIRQHSQAAAVKVKLEGGENDLLDRLLADPAFHLTKADLEKVLDISKFVGLAPRQTEMFLAAYVRPVLAKYAADLGVEAETNV